MRLTVINKMTGMPVDSESVGVSGWMIDEYGLLLMRDRRGRMRYVRQNDFIVAYTLESQKDVFMTASGKLCMVSGLKEEPWDGHEE